MSNDVYEKKLTEQSHIAPMKSQAGEQAQAKFSVHNVDKNRPKPKYSGYKTMAAPIATTTFGGRIKPFGYFRYLAGAKIKNLKCSGIARMEPLRHPSFDKFKMRMFAVYVPNSRVWSNSEKFAAQKNDNFSPAPTSVPTVTFPRVYPGVSASTYVDSFRFYDMTVGATVPWVESSLFRDTWVYNYYGRVPYNSSPTQYLQRTYNALILRGGIAAYNDCFRPRVELPALVEFNGDTVTPQEFALYYQPDGEVVPSSTSSIIQTNPNAVPAAGDKTLNTNILLPRAGTQVHYWNNYRSEVYNDNSPVDNTSLFTHNVTQQMIDEYRAQSQNEDLTDEEIVAHLRGTYVAKENRAYIIGEKTIDIDISLQPNTSESASPPTLSLGADGALSYTDFSMPIVGNLPFSAPKDGFIHYFYDIIAADDGMTADSQNIEALQTEWRDFYRPSMSVIKDRPLYETEVVNNTMFPSSIRGFIDRFSEYFRHPKFIRGDFNNITPITQFVGTGRNSPISWYWSDPIRSNGIPSKFDWCALREEPRSAVGSGYGTILPPKVNYSDYAIHRLLWDRGSDTALAPATITLELLQYRLPQTFSLYGSISVDVEQPIDDRVKRKFIPFGEE